MMQFWALIKDSFRESIDRKIFWIMVFITLFVALAMASVGFEDGKVRFFFGLLTSQTERFDPMSELGRSRLVGIVVYLLLSGILGTVGIALMIIATASTFPSLIERGAIDIVLSKPISRARLFLYRYVGGMVFVALQGTLFVVLTFLVMGLRWGVWAPGYLASLPLLILLFSYIYCVSVLVGIKTRSTVAAILISIAAWFAFALIHQAPQLFDTYPSLQENRRLYTMVRIVSWIPPKTGDFDYLAARWAQAGTSSDIIPLEVLAASSEADRMRMGRAREVEERELLKNPLYPIGSSLLFEGVIVLWAMWCFSRRDY